ncbi:MAG: MIP/aquaporin family protein [Saprospiraceae bacterium]|nr:MIP/aquaporin family protein [Saprospiraceae bacterium]
MAEHFIGEFFGTMFLLILGCGVVANVLLHQSKGQHGGWIVITFGWAMGVFVGVYTAVNLGGSGHLNPAITLALAFFKDFNKALILPYILAQMSGAIVGSGLVWLMYKQHFDITEDKNLVRAVFCNSPAIRNTWYNLFTEIIATFVLGFGALAMSKPTDALGTLNALPVALLVLGIGLSLGGPTGYAINPARDLGPRIAHFLLPIKTKGHSDWSYSWIPVAGPIIGASMAVLIYNML